MSEGNSKGKFARLGSKKAKTVIYPAIVIVIVLIFAVEYLALDYTMESINSIEKYSSDSDKGTMYLNKTLSPITEKLAENTEKSFEFKIKDNVLSFVAFMIWSDEPDETPMINMPDYFKLNLISPLDETIETAYTPNPPGAEGALAVALDRAENESGKGTWIVIVSLGECGDQTGIFRTMEDTGNSFTLQCHYTYAKEA